MLAAEFIKPIQHPHWLFNVVLVKKKNRQIRCCVDFKNLNKVCPKNEFPLPNMDLLIDSAVGSTMFSFIDGLVGIIKSEWHQRMRRKLPSEHL